MIKKGGYTLKDTDGVDVAQLTLKYVGSKEFELIVRPTADDAGVSELVLLSGVTELETFKFQNMPLNVPDYSATFPVLDLPAGTIINFDTSKTPIITAISGDNAAGWLTVGSNKNNVLGLWTEDGGVNINFGFFTVNDDGSFTANGTPFYTTLGGWRVSSYTLINRFESDGEYSENLASNSGFSFDTDVTIIPPSSGTQAVDALINKVANKSEYFTITKLANSINAIDQ